MGLERLAVGLRRARRLPPGLLAREAAHRIGRAAVGLSWRLRDKVCATYAETGRPGSLRTYAPTLDPPGVAARVPDLAERCARYLEHRFDLLGSGWRTVRHGMGCDGFEGYRYETPAPRAPDPDGRWLTGQVSRPNLPAARAAWRLIDPAYRPIDWHVDSRSGYRWSPMSWYRRVPYGHRPGVDIKAPWELARMQHLPQLALAFGCARAGLTGFLPPARYRDEFRHQVLDFAATNPPRYGVNWRSAMEVAIRVANWLLARDLFLGYGARFDPDFEAVFGRSIREHGRHIAGNLERTPAWSNNHYLANLTGLIFVAAYLPPSSETARWWRVGSEGLAGEIDRQFLADGGHFEASTSYHALAAALVSYALALVCARERRAENGAEGIPGSARSILSATPVGERLGRMAEFMVHLTGPDGRIVQLGDHDSGRLFKLQPGSRLDRDGVNRSSPGLLTRDAAPVPDEEHLSSGHAVAGINGLLGRADLAAWCAGRWLDEPLIAGLASDSPWRLPNRVSGRTQAEQAAMESRGGFDELCGRLGAEPAAETSRVVLTVNGGSSLRADLRSFAYPDFGAYVFRSGRLFLCLRAGFGCHDGTGGHAHVDQLGLEVWIDGVGWIRDPGAYVYTADPDWRNAYRSGAAHFVPYILEGEDDLWRNGPFDLALNVRVLAIAVDGAAIAAELDIAGNRIGQVLTIEPQEIVVETKFLDPSRSSRLRARRRSAHDGRYVFGRDTVTTGVPFSPGYGLQD